MQDVNTIQYREISQDNQKKIIIFSAPWCGPCRMFKPVLDKVSKELGIPFYAINIDEESELATELNIRSVPTTFLYTGTEVTTIIGAKPESEIISILS